MGFPDSVLPVSAVGLALAAASAVLARRHHLRPFAAGWWLAVAALAVAAGWLAEPVAGLALAAAGCLALGRVLALEAETTRREREFREVLQRLAILEARHPADKGTPGDGP